MLWAGSEDYVHCDRPESGRGAGFETTILGRVGGALMKTGVPCVARKPGTVEAKAWCR